MSVEAARAGRGELGRLLLGTGAMGAGWAATFAAVDRADFLPDVMWPFGAAAGGCVAVDRGADPDGWYAAADSNVPIVTQWDDGRHTGREPGRVGTSSSSMPSVVYRMLGTLAAEGGQRVLDVGTGTGETAAALVHRCGPGRVTTIEVDPEVSLRARERLGTAGFHPEVVVGDGSKGYAQGAAYDRILATVGLREIPGAWVEQTRPGGLIVAPWGTHFSHADAVVALTVRGGEASGRFAYPAEFMKLRAQRTARPAHAAAIGPDAFAGADTSATSLTEADIVTGAYSALPFALGLRVRDCVQAVADKRDGARPVWFYGLTDESWAAVMFRDGEGDARVWQSGPRRLWDEVESAYAWWADHARPDHARFGLTITPGGPRAWLDAPNHSWPV